MKYQRVIVETGDLKYEFPSLKHMQEGMSERDLNTGLYHNADTVYDKNLKRFTKNRDIGHSRLNDLLKFSGLQGETK